MSDRVSGRQPTVSVVIPTYNRGPFLSAAIDSVLRQSFDDLELVIVDDGSQDDTARIVAGWRDPRLRYLAHTRNRGDGAARNSGIEASTGTYVAFLDDDDEWLETKLERQVAVMEAAPGTALVHTGRVDIAGDTGEILRIHDHPGVTGDAWSAVIERNCVTTSSVLVRRDCFATVGLFDESIPATSDYDMWIRLARKHRFAYIDRPLIKYRVHGVRISTSWALVVRGRRALFAKYEDEFSKPTRYNAVRHLEFGTVCCLSGDVAAGRALYAKATRLHLWSGKAYLAWCLTWFGADRFAWIIRVLNEYRRSSVRPRVAQR